jgi:hypothetical protein
MNVMKFVVSLLTSTLELADFWTVWFLYWMCRIQRKRGKTSHLGKQILKGGKRFFFLFNSTLNIFYMQAYHLVYVILKYVFYFLFFIFYFLSWIPNWFWVY